MRFTKRFEFEHNSDFATSSRKTIIQVKDGDEDGALEKLSFLEDIEDELGIDLFTLFKALENGAYFRNPYYKNEITELHNLEPDIIFTQRCFDISMERFVSPGIYSSGGAFFFFKDYGKTWALTKEELE